MASSEAAGSNPQRPLPPGASPRSGTVPPEASRWKPGQSGNPKGRPKNAGQSLLERVNQLTAEEPTVEALRRIVRNPNESFLTITAAKQMLQGAEHATMADFEPLN